LQFLAISRLISRSNRNLTVNILQKSRHCLLNSWKYSWRRKG